MQAWMGRVGSRFGGTSLVVLLAAALAGCGSDQAEEQTGPLTVPSSEVHVLGTSESIGEVEDLAVLPDGAVWLLNSAEPFFIGFGPDGSVAHRYGASGGGPEEFRMPAGFLSGGLEGQAWVFDFIRHAFIRVSEPNEWAELDIPRDAIPSGSVRGGMSLMSATIRTARLGNELVVPWTAGNLEDGVSSYHMALMKAHLAAFDPRSGAVREIVTLGDVLDDPSEGFEATAGGFPLWYRLWAACGDQLRAYDRVRNQLRGFTGTGEEVTPIDLPPVPFTEVSGEEFARAVFPLRQAEVTGGVGPRLSPEDSVRLVRQMAQELKGSGSELAAYLPRYVDFRCSDRGDMWLQPLDLDAGGLQGGARWIRITPDGVARDVRLPDRFDAFRFQGGRIWGIQRDEFDVASVAWIAFSGT